MSHFISRQDIDKNKLSVFLRDLSTDLNVNLKHMIEDTIIKVDEESKKESKNYQRGKKKKPKRKKLTDKERRQWAQEHYELHYTDKYSKPWSPVAISGHHSNQHNQCTNCNHNNTMPIMSSAQSYIDYFDNLDQDHINLKKFLD